ncbi:MAG TPA: protein kinase [Planctomycetota bacterium]|nr:protein kinase [Planctomycetota bacterium]
MPDPLVPPGLAAKLGKLFGAEQDRSLGRLAVQRGRLSEAQLAEALQEGERSARPLADILVERGWISSAELTALRESADRDDYSAFKVAGAAIPSEVAEHEKDPARRVAGLVLVQRLGRGGSGEVWKAWDRRLGRWCAVKFPIALPEEGAALDRFAREAVVAARLSHPNIVSIHGVAEEAGRPYIVMQYVEGRTLQEAPPPLRQAVEAIRDAALAVHAAHELGVVHRDLKPANLMRDKDGRVLVLDFGLARLAEGGRGLSEQGVLAGTAAYMPPEQATGDPRGLDRTTDVYALGATLYHLAAGRPPFDGATFAETVHRVTHEEPPRPRLFNPSIPVDLETILLKAMHKDPARRYPTALAFSEELGRFLADEPILARRDPLLYGVYRRVRRHPRTALLAALLLAVAAAALLAGRGIARREREASLATIRETARVSLQAALELRRAGANARMEEFLPRLESAYRQALDRAPETAEVEYLMGRFHRALMNDARALEFQDRALAKDPAYPPALYERAILASKNYGRGLRKAYGVETALAPGRVTADAARRSDTPSLEAFGERRDDLIRMRDTIVRDCLDLERALGGFAEANALAARGILAFHRGAIPEARDLLEKAVGRDPLLEEAWETLALAAMAPVNQSTPVERVEQAWADAERAYREGLARDRGYLPHWLGRGGVRSARANLYWDTGRDPSADFAGAEADFAEALRLRPSADAYIRRSGLYHSMGAHDGRQGRDPRPAWKKSDDDLREALRLDPSNGLAWSRLAYNCRSRGEYFVERGRSPLEECRLAEDYIARALQIDSRDGSAWMNRGALLACRGMDRASRGEDPREDFDRAEQAYNEALRFDRLVRGPWERRGYLRLQRARWTLARGGDGAADLRLAEEDLTRCIEVSSRFTMARLARAMVRHARGDLAGAEADLTFVLRDNPTYPEAWIALGQVHLAAGGKERAAKAVEAFQKGLDLDSTLDNPRLRESMSRARAVAEPSK